MANITATTSRNFDDAFATALAGSITSSTASAIITGVGTAFNATNTPIGCPIYSGTTYLGNVLSIQSTTQLTLTANALATVSGATNGFAYLNLALNNQDIYTITNGATLTVNSDNLYSQQAAYPYYFEVGKGTLNFDGTTVWWIPFDASSGNVPSIGTCGVNDVTVGGVAVGEFLEVYTALATVPLNAGVVMPAAGFVKFRSKTGTINDNDVLTFSNGATATVNSATGGQRGWLQFYMMNNGNFQNLQGIRSGYEATINFNGDWFELGTGTGVAAMTLQHYVGEVCPAVQIETASGSGVYEWWCCIPSANTASFDTGHRIFTCANTGLLTFGGSTWGKIPPSGAKIRVPNLYISSAYNNTPALVATTAMNYRPNLAGQGRYTLNKTMFTGYTFTSALFLEFNDCAILEGVGSSNLSEIHVRESVELDNCGIGSIGQNTYAVFMQQASLVSVTNCTIYRGAGSPFYIANSKNITINNVLAVATGPNNQFLYSTALTATNLWLIGGANQTPLNMTACSDFTFTGTKISSRLISTGTAAYAAMILNGCSDGVFIGMDYVSGYSYWPQYDFCVAQNNCTRVHFRDIGSLTTPFIPQNSGTARQLIYPIGAADIHLSRCYFQAGSYSYPSGSGIDIYASDSGYTNFAANPWYYSSYQSGVAQRVYGNAMPGNANSNRVPIFADVLTSATTLTLYINPSSEKRLDSVLEADAYTETNGPFVRNAGNVYMPTAGQVLTYTWNYPILGITSFATTATTITGTNTGNFSIEYDLDKGAGFSGTYKTLNATNLSAETGISPTGVRPRVRFTVNTSNASNAIFQIRIYANTTATDCANNLYPYNNPPVTVTGGLSNTICSIFRTSDGKRLDTRTGSSSIALLPAWYANTAAVLRVRKPGYYPVESGFTLTERSTGIPVSQIDSPIPDTNPGTTGITVTNHGASPVTWNSKQWSITVTVTSGASAATIAQYLSWHTAQDAYTLVSGFHNTALPPMVIAVGTNYETERGVLYGSAGATLKGVRVVDGSGNEIPGFARMQADDGTYYSPAASYTLTVSNIVSNSRILVRRTDTLAVIANQTVTTGSFAYTYTHTVDIPIEIVVRKATAAPYYQEWRTTTTLTNSNNAQTANQLLDT